MNTPGINIQDRQWYLLGQTDARAGNAKDEKVRAAALAGTGYSVQALVTCKQVHSAEVVWVSPSGPKLHPGKDGLPRRPSAVADGLLTNVSGLVLGVYSADCMPVFLAEPQNKRIGVVHAGWRGTSGKIATAALAEILKNSSGNASSVQVHFGPHIRGCCYEVGRDTAKHFSQESYRETGGKILLSLEKAVKLELQAAGVPAANMTSDKLCTYCSPNFFSYRKDKTEQRMLSFIVKK